MNNPSFRVFIFWISFLLLPPLLFAEVEQQAEQQDEVVIGTRVVPPFVMQNEDGSYTGITIHLWEQIAEELDLNFRYEETDIQGMLDGVADGR